MLGQSRINILVTGGASGLGKAITERLAGESDSFVYFTYYSSDENAKKIEDLFPNTKGLKCDFSNADDIRVLTDLVEGSNIDVLINNAISNFTKKHFVKFTDNEISDSFITNVMPVVQVSRAFLKAARKRKFGKIITVLTSAIQQPTIGYSAYTAEKMYLYGMSRSWNKENIAFNITCNCISPGFMQTHLQSDTDERIIEDMVAQHPLKQLLKVEETADVIAFLCTASQQINDQNIFVGQ